MCFGYLLARIFGRPEDRSEKVKPGKDDKDDQNGVPGKENHGQDPKPLVPKPGDTFDPSPSYPTPAPQPLYDQVPSYPSQQWTGSDEPLDVVPALPDPEWSAIQPPPAASLPSTFNPFGPGGGAQANIFSPISTQDIPIPTFDTHPVPTHCIRGASWREAPPPSQTNAFYGNWLVSGQGCGVWTHPYSLSWSKGQGNARSWGIAVSHFDKDMFAFAEKKSLAGGSQYYLNPIGVQSIIFSAKEIGAVSSLTLDSVQAFSVQANLSPIAGAPAILTLPVLQGMGFVTALYKGATPLVQSSVIYRDVTPAGTINDGATSKYRLLLEDGKTWLLYVTPQSSNDSSAFNKVNTMTMEGPPKFYGTVQVAKLPLGSSEEYYDRSAGAYAVSCTISATTAGNQGTYNMTWKKSGLSKPLLMWALSHHSSVFSPKTKPNVTPMHLQTTTKGMATAVVADSWQINETLPTDMSFTPWSPTKTLPAQLSPAAKTAVIEAAKLESEQDVLAQSDVGSMYFSGKGLGKFAMMIIALHDMAGERDMALKILEKLKTAFAVFVENRQKTPLVYEKSWSGVVSKVGMDNSMSDFGNGYYNDHHFHYGYFVYTAAVIGRLDPAWLEQGSNRAWVNMLVQDFANPVNDSKFPFSRSFDWFHGHSWAKGLFESGDGKDEESTSEDAFASYALKMWGHVSGDANLEARGNLMLAVQARVFQTYFLMEKTNTTQPEQMRANKVTGITFENKIDHATYFGLKPEFIQGIQMIPLAPPSALIRTPTFVREEWEVYFDNGRVDNIAGGWRGILYANWALVDPKSAYEFFAKKDFNAEWLDGGASRTWYLAWCAALGGA